MKSLKKVVYVKVNLVRLQKRERSAAYESAVEDDSYSKRQRKLHILIQTFLFFSAQIATHLLLHLAIVKLVK